MNYQSGIDYNRDVEKNIIGVLILESSSFERVSGLIDAKHFYDNNHKQFFNAIKLIKQDGKHVDLVTVVDYVIRILKQPSSLVSEIVSCTNKVTSSATLEQSAYAIVQMYRIRELKRITTTPISDDMDINDAISHLEAQISTLRSESTLSSVDMENGLISLTRYQDKVRDLSMLGITTGFGSIDSATSGYVDGGLYVIAARPSVGKSAFMGKNVLHAGLSGKKVGIIQLEMSIEQTIARISSLYSDIDYSKIITGFKYDEALRDKFYGCMDKMANLPISINPSANLSIESIKSFSYALHRKGKLDILFIDYLQLIDQKGGRSREQEVSQISRGLKLLARDLQIPVVALSQLNRSSESRSNKKPILADLRESGAIEQDADAVYFIHRDYAMGIEKDENGNSTEDKAELIIAKNRNGSRMTIPLLWDGRKMKFMDTNEY